MIALFAGMFRRNIIELRRYAFDTFFQIAGIYVLFMLLFYGAENLGGHSVRSGETLSSIVVGFGVFSLVLISYSTISNWMTMEATLGTLEQIAMCPFGMLTVLFAEFVAAIVYEVAIVGALMLAAEGTTGRWLHVDVLALTPVIFFLLVQLLGIGLLLGGTAMVFKRVTSLTNLVQFGLLALIAAPVSRHHWMRLLPVSLAEDLIRKTTVAKVSLSHFGAGNLAILAVTSCVYLAGGVAAFKALERRARARGVIGVH